jgi:hypothetical protein
MKRKFQQLGVTVLGIAIAAAACKKTTINDIKSNDKVFSSSLFKENIIKALGARNIGYTFMINQNGKWAYSAARGFARMNHFSRCEKRNEYCQRKQMADCCGAMKFCRKKRSNSRIPFCLVPRYVCLHR